MLLFISEVTQVRTPSRRIKYYATKKCIFNFQITSVLGCYYAATATRLGDKQHASLPQQKMVGPLRIELRFYEL